MSAIGHVVRAAEANRDAIRRVATSEVGARLVPPLRARWLPLPPASPERRLGVGVDGTGHAVSLATGAHLVVSMASALGPEPVGRIDLAEVEALPARYDDAAASSARDLLMRSLETAAAHEALRRAAGVVAGARTTIWIDGSLHGDLAHMAGGPAVARWGGAADRAGALLVATRALHLDAVACGARLLGLAKTQRAAVLVNALEAEAPPGLGGPGERPRDGEVLAAMPDGWSWPVVLDAGQFPSPDPAAMAILESCPAIVTTYVRPHPADLPLRLDVPAAALGLPDRLGRPSRPGTVIAPRWLADPDLMRPFVAEVTAAYGGIIVHNGPLYAIDRLVRLTRRDLETVVLPAIARAAGVPASALGVDRGRRRFILD